MTEVIIPTENSNKQSDNTKTPQKSWITQWLRTELGRSVVVAITTQIVYAF